jgi:hypothetical protein
MMKKGVTVQQAIKAARCDEEYQVRRCNRRTAGEEM